MHNIVKVVISVLPPFFLPVHGRGTQLLSALVAAAAGSGALLVDNSTQNHYHYYESWPSLCVSFQISCLQP
jgi:hypothetical protein